MYTGTSCNARSTDLVGVLSLLSSLLSLSLLLLLLLLLLLWSLLPLSKCVGDGGVAIGMSDLVMCFWQVVVDVSVRIFHSFSEVNVGLVGLKLAGRLTI